MSRACTARKLCSANPPPSVISTVVGGWGASDLVYWKERTTTGNIEFDECFYICRVYFLGHSANKFFDECFTKNTRQRGGLPSVKKHSAKRGFAECFLFCTWQRNKIFFWKRRRRKKMKKNFAECPDLGHSAKVKSFVLAAPHCLPPPFPHLPPPHR